MYFIGADIGNHLPCLNDLHELTPSSRSTSPLTWYSNLHRQRALLIDHARVRQSQHEFDGVLYCKEFAKAHQPKRIRDIPPRSQTPLFGRLRTREPASNPQSQNLDPREPARSILWPLQNTLSISAIGVGVESNSLMQWEARLSRKLSYPMHL